MLLHSKIKKILWVSKKTPPLISGANFDVQHSGRNAISKWKKDQYMIVLADTGALSDGLTGFDVLRNIRALNSKFPVYIMVSSMMGPETNLAARLRANGVIPHSFNDIQTVLRTTNAINWAARTGQNESLGKRLIGFLRPSSKDSPDVIHDETTKSQEIVTIAREVDVEDIMSDLRSLDIQEETLDVSTLLPAVIPKKSFNELVVANSLSGKTSMHYNITNPHQLSLQFNKLGPDFEEADRQFAWELYTELATRAAVTGKANDPTCTNVDGELWSESFASLLAFCKELRSLLRTFPAKYAKNQLHLGGLIITITKVVLNPFLDRWRVDYLHWWEYSSDKSQPPLVRQSMYPRTQEMLVEWRQLKMTLRAVQDTIEKAYKLNG